MQIPLLTADDIDSIPDGALVRYRGMVIMFSPFAHHHLSKEPSVPIRKSALRTPIT